MKTFIKKLSNIFPAKKKSDEKGEDFYGEKIGKKEENDNWPYSEYDEGQLSIDVYQTPESLVVVSTIAGVKSEDLDISINNDMLTIRGKRRMMDDIRNEDYLYRECYWGAFSRSIILPIEIKVEEVDAFIENGVLNIILPKSDNAKAVSIKVKEK